MPRSSPCWRSTGRTYCGPASATSTGLPNCGQSPTGSPIKPSPLCSSLKRPTCTRSTLELTPPTPFFHGHAISIDMALSISLAEQRGHLSATDRDRVLDVMSALGLALDSDYLTAELLSQATVSILRTRDGLLRAAVPDPIGRCRFLNDVTTEELADTLRLHKKLCREYDRGGAGVDMFAAPSPA